MFRENTPPYKLPEYHKEIFGTDQPFLRHEIYHKLFGFAGRSLSRHIYPVLSEKQKIILHKKFIKNAKLKMLRAITMKGGMAQHQWLIDAVKEEGIKTPLLVVIDSKNLCWIEEGHHRAGAALINNLERVPVFIFIRCDGENNFMKQLESYKELIS